MLDHYPTTQEVLSAQQNFDWGCATPYDMQVLQVAHPWRDYGHHDPIAEFLSIFDL